MPYPAVGDGPGLGPTPAAVHAVPMEERPAPLLGPFTPEEPLLGAVPSTAPPLHQSAWDTLGHSLIESLLVGYQPRVLQLLGIWGRCGFLSLGPAVSSPRIAGAPRLNGGAAGSVGVTPPQPAPRRCKPEAALEPCQKAVGGTTDSVGVAPPRPVPRWWKPGPGSPPPCALPAQTDGGVLERGAALPLGDASGSVPCPCCCWAVPYPAVGDGPGLGSTPAAAHAAPPAPDSCGVEAGSPSAVDTGLGSADPTLPVFPPASPAELLPTPPASGSQASPEPAAGASPPPSPPAAVADQGLEVFITGSGGDVPGEKPVALTGQGSQAAGAPSAGLWTLSS
ncbi:skin secretory protein xP2-like [Parus major]|uniref:skin secretory protein xP2-like n=1 Tax=Parus major TaxID=9157 RepID=UPI000771333C|nr:skin secretory protein xP2-like [Parus major]